MIPPQTLDEIACELGTDKCSASHGYAPIYERWLAPLREMPITLLEIGIQDGFSHLMWERYFTHPKARIFGLDIAAESVEGVMKRSAGKITAVLGDQGDPVTLAALMNAISGPCDVVIDDGSHRWADQQTSFRCLWPKVRPGGQYWVEDLLTSYLPDYKTGATRSTVEVLKTVVDEVHLGAGCCEEIHFWKELCLLRKRGF